MPVVKIIELIGTSSESWEMAVKSALDEASASIKNIETIEVANISGNVEDGKISEWQANVRIAFRIQADLRPMHHEHHAEHEKVHA